MNNKRECYVVIDKFPAKVKLRMKSRPPEKKWLKPVFKKLGSDKCIFKPTVLDIQGKEITLLLPFPRCPLEAGRYEICIHDQCCEPCDCVEVWLEADCKIESFEVIEVEENCDVC